MTGEAKPLVTLNPDQLLRKRERLQWRGRSGGDDEGWLLEEMAYKITFVFLVILLKVTPHLQNA